MPEVVAADAAGAVASASVVVVSAWADSVDSAARERVAA